MLYLKSFSKIVLNRVIINHTIAASTGSTIKMAAIVKNNMVRILLMKNLDLSIQFASNLQLL